MLDIIIQWFQTDAQDITLENRSATMHSSSYCRTVVAMQHVISPTTNSSSQHPIGSWNGNKTKLSDHSSMASIGTVNCALFVEIYDPNLIAPNTYCTEVIFDGSLAFIISGEVFLYLNERVPKCLQAKWGFYCCEDQVNFIFRRLCSAKQGVAGIYYTS